MVLTIEANTAILRLCMLKSSVRIFQRLSIRAARTRRALAALYQLRKAKQPHLIRIKGRRTCGTQRGRRMACGSAAAFACLIQVKAGGEHIAQSIRPFAPRPRRYPCRKQRLSLPRFFFHACLQGVTQTPRMDVARDCIATPMADVSSIEPPRQPPTTSVQSVSSGATDAVFRTSRTIHSSRRGPMLHAKARQAAIGEQTRDHAESKRGDLLAKMRK